MAAAMSPGRADVLLTRAAVHVQRGFPERALPLLAQAGQAGGGRKVMLQQALCFYKTGRLAKAAGFLSRLLLQEPRLGAAREMLALVFIRQGRFHEAHDQLSRVGRRGAVGARCRKYSQIVRRVLRGQISEGAAVAFFQAQALERAALDERASLLAEAQGNDFPEAMVELALVKLKSDKKEALRLLERACSSPLASGDAHFRMGMVLHDLGKTERAISSLQKACEIDATNPEARVRLGVLLASSGNSDEALRHFRRAIHLSPTDGRAYAQAGAILAKAGQRESAQDYLEEAMLLNPFDSDSSRLLNSLEN